MPIVAYTKGTPPPQLHNRSVVQWKGTWYHRHRRQRTNLQLHKMPRVRSQRNKHCKTIGCLYFTNDTHCSGCKSGLTQKKEKFEKALKKVVNELTKGSKEAIGETVHETISNLIRKDTFLKAKDVLKFCQMTEYEMDWWYPNPQLALPLSKLLMRVVDYWNIHRDLGFNETIQCYWNSYDDRRNLMEQMYRDRKKLLVKPGLAYVTKQSTHLPLIQAIKKII